MIMRDETRLKSVYTIVAIKYTPISFQLSLHLKKPKIEEKKGYPSIVVGIGCDCEKKKKHVGIYF